MKIEQRVEITGGGREKEIESNRVREGHEAKE